MSRSGPFGPIFSGVWQSLQAPTVTKYFPRSMRDVCWLAESVAAVVVAVAVGCWAFFPPPDSALPQLTIAMVISAKQARIMAVTILSRMFDCVVVCAGMVVLSLLPVDCWLIARLIACSLLPDVGLFGNACNIAGNRGEVVHPNG